MCDQLAILCTPAEYCSATVLPAFSSDRAPRCYNGSLFTDVGKLSILENKEVMLLTELLKILDDRLIKIFNDIDVGLQNNS
jgi:hypothetical protein